MVIGRYATSFFNPALANAAGTFGTLAAVGAISAPLTILTKMLIDSLIKNSGFFAKHPKLKATLNEATDILLSLATSAAAATMLGLPPLGATVIVSHVVPVAIFAMNAIISSINSLLNLIDNEPEEPTEAASVAAP